MKKFSILIVLLALLLTFALASCEEQEEVSEHVHNYSENVISPTCLEKGYTNRVCVDCGETTNYDFTPISDCKASGVWVTTKAPTCNSQGERKQSCLYCDTVLMKEAIETTEHQPVTVVKQAPNCLSMGVEETYCNACDTVLSSKNIDKTDSHEYEMYSVPPTAQTQGYTNYICKRCGDTQTGSYVDFEESAVEIYNKIKSATVYIKAFDKSGKMISLGSGFVVSEDGYIYTNYHVIKSAYSLKVQFYDGTIYPVTSVQGYNIANDVAKIKIAKSSCDYLKISTEKVKTGDTVYTLGNPLGVENIFTSGIVSRESIKVNGIDCIAITAPISPGNSGGPLLNKRGEVVGINSLQIPDAQNLNFAILIEKVSTISGSPVTVSALYNQRLAENAFEVFTNYINVNANRYDGDNPMIYTLIEETSELVGFEYIYYLDTEANAVYIQITVINAGRKQYALELVISGVSSTYDISMYEYETAQTIATGKVNVQVQTISFETSFSKMFEFSVFRGNATSEEETTRQEQIFYTMYLALVEDFGNLLAKSNTGLSISYFKFS